MKKCFTINPYRTTEDFKEYEKLIEDNVYQAIEIFYPYTLNEENYRTYFNNVLAIYKKYKNVEIVMHLPHGPLNNLCDFVNYERIVKIMKDGIDFCAPFNVKKLTLHLGQVDKNKSRTLYVDHIVKVLKDLCLYAKKYNMNVMIENMPTDDELGYSPSEIKEIINRVGETNLKFILDTGHANVSDYEIEEYIELLSDKLFHLHFSDNNGERDEHKRIGLGVIDFNKVFSSLKKIKYQELHCMEVIFKSSNDLLAYSKDFDKFDIY